MFRYKVDIFAKLKENGYSQARIEKERLLSTQTCTNIRRGKSVTLETLNKICVMCNCQLSDIVEIVPTDEEKEKYKNL